MKKLIVSSLLMIVLVLNAIPVFAYNGTMGDTSPGTEVDVTDGFNTQKTGYRVSLKRFDSGQDGWFGVTGSYTDFWFTKPDIDATNHKFYGRHTKSGVGIGMETGAIYMGLWSDISNSTKSALATVFLHCLVQLNQLCIQPKLFYPHHFENILL